jgi:hypothetical protein
MRGVTDIVTECDHANKKFPYLVAENSRPARHEILILQRGSIR